MAQRLSATGTVQSSSVYDGYGGGGVTPDPFGYHAQDGYYTDVETGLCYCQNQYYDPGTGRWVTRDPIGYDGGINLYGYCEGGAVGRVDPWGTDYVLLGDPGYDGYFQAALDNLRGTEKGRDIVREILDPKTPLYKFNIHHGGGSDGDGLTRYINIDLDDLEEQQYPCKDGTWEYFSWEHVIAHEMGHAAGGLKGTLKDEQKAVDEWENPATAATGQPTRGKYGVGRKGKRRRTPLPTPVYPTPQGGEV